MLSEITIQDFAIIDQLTLQFGPGFNVLTGETGAGKSIILDAASLLLGGRAESDVVRDQADKALVEGLFILGGGPSRERIEAVLSREGMEGDEPGVLVLAREVRREGRNICRINGRTATLNLLREIGEGLIDIHGQSEHLSLLKPASHLDLLDRYGQLEKGRAAFGQVVRQVHAVRRELRNLLENEDALRQRAEMLAYQVEEINAANLKPGEDEALREEGKRLSNAEQLTELVGTAYQAIYEGDEERPSANDLLSQAAAALAKLAKIDPHLQDMAELAETVSIQAEEMARGLREYEEQIEYDPVRLQETEMRLDLINILKRKYNCADIKELLVVATDAAQALENIEHSGERIVALRTEEKRLLAELARQGAALSTARREAANALAQAVETELADLRMPEARFGVEVEQVADSDGVPLGDTRVAFDERGIDRVEFLIAPNVGESLKPLVRIASGGETSRIMLALKSVLSRADHTPTLIFDEIDAGIGGRMGAVVGHKLWSLSGEHQVLVVTHLPQLAGFGDRHFKVEKAVKQRRTVALVWPLEGEARIQELTDMLGAEADSARQSAEELLTFVQQIKEHERMPSEG